MRASIPWLGALLFLGGLTSCAIGLGQPCNAETPCPKELTCAFPRVDGGVAANGICDYPPRGEGQPCTVAAECESSLTCSNHFTPNDRYGVCTQKRGEGEPCFVNRDCLSNKCSGATGTALDGTCAPGP